MNKQAVFLISAALTFVALGLLAHAQAATTYYVDNCVVTGNNGNNGTSSSTPWLTLAYVSAHSFSPGDSIMLRGGCVWRESLSIGYSGSNGNPITVTSYGTGKAIIDGSDVLSSGWSFDSGNIWKHSLTISYVAHAWVFFNGVAGGPNGGNPMPSKAAIVAPNEWFWDSGASMLYVYSTSDPGTAFTNPGIEATTRSGAAASNRSYITFDNLNVRKTSESCFDLYQLSHGTVQNTVTSYCGKNNIVFYNSTPGTSDNYAIANNTASYCAEDCIAGKSSSNGLIYGNDASHAGIRLDDESSISISGTSDNNEIYDNYVHDNTDQTGSVGIRGIIVDTITSGDVNYVHHNWANKCNGSGIQVVDASGQWIYYNISSNNPTGGNSYVKGFQDVWTSGPENTGNVFYGNTAYNNAYANFDIYAASDTLKNNISEGSPNGLILESGATGIITDYNLVHGATTNYSWLGTGYSTAAAYYAASGQGQHDTNSNPLFVSTSTNNFALQAGSPAINAGTNLGSTYEYGLASGSSWPSSVSLLNQNSYGSGWEIGAYVYGTSGVTNMVTSRTTVTNSAPTISAVYLNHGSTINLTANATTSFDINYTITDNNGCGDINTSLGTSTAMRGGVSSTCAISNPATNNLNCYKFVSRTSSACAGGVQLSINVTDTVALYYFAQSTGNNSSSFPSDGWIAWVQASDYSNATGSAFSSPAVNVGVLTGITVTTSSINYDTVSASSTTGSTNQTAIVANVGNSSATIQLYALTTLMSGTRSIQTSSQRYSTSTFTYPGTSTALTDSPVLVPGFFLTSPTSTANVSKSTFWGLWVPVGT